MKHFPIGSVSTATMREEDLIPTFCYELRNMPHVSRDHKRMVRQIEARTQTEGYYQSEECMWDLESLFGSLNAYAGPFLYFGSHPGDGADYGFWLSESWDEDGDVLKVSDLSEVEPVYVGFVAVINDHGNITLYKRSRNHRCYLLWDMV